MNLQWKYILINSTVLIKWRATLICINSIENTIKLAFHIYGIVTPNDVQWNNFGNKYESL